MVDGHPNDNMCQCFYFKSGQQFLTRFFKSSLCLHGCKENWTHSWHSVNNFERRPPNDRSCDVRYHSNVLGKLLTYDGHPHSNVNFFNLLIYFFYSHLMMCLLSSSKSTHPSFLIPQQHRMLPVRI